MKSVKIFRFNNLYMVDADENFIVYVHGAGKCLKIKKNCDILSQADIICYIKFNILDAIYLCTLLLVPVAEVFVLYKLISFNWDVYIISWYTIVLNVAFLLVNILLHEFGHWITMIIHNISIGAPKIQFSGQGIKVSTETGAAVLFPWYRKLLVYGIGITINSLMMVVFVLINLTPYVILTLVATLFNIIPIYGINNDVAMIVDLVKKGG